MNMDPRQLNGCEVLPPMDDRKPARNNTPPGKRERRKTGGRFAVLNAFADFSLAELDRAEIAVWLLLWRDTKPDGIARTSQADLARRAGVTDRTAKRAVARLRRLGLLIVVHRGGLRRGVSTYRVQPLAKPP